MERETGNVIRESPARFPFPVSRRFRIADCTSECRFLSAKSAIHNQGDRMGAVLDLFNVLIEPTAVFERLREKPKFLAPFLVLAVVLAITVVVLMPYQRAAMAERIAQIVQQNPQAAAAIQNAQKFAFAGVVFAPPIFGTVLPLIGPVPVLLLSSFRRRCQFT